MIMETAKKLKVGDYIMVDRSSVNYSTFALVEGIEKRQMQFGKEKIILNLKHLYKRQRITEDGTMNEMLFTYEYHNNLPITPDSLLCERVYKITETEYIAVKKAVRAYFDACKKAQDITRDIYFKQKEKKRNT